ncbi:hypothetical protein [Mucilaginibacter psychrotolerans]|uniref:DUF4815 domain-containing protein n=1 Tax=Mucilaginibacter psychrotolerans TaxID=1524096 RepID=A0A4Y8S483_9SPHI|nr:hypothetical protein [Mucilaginibacter psychrotolerans]TFF32178.1 hypothetical protein E2R66_27005 [Mucilaginibacter psychrotolerans]
MQLYINNQLADLADDSPIALTFQINNLAEVKNQQGNTSNQFKLPLTQRNRQILGFPDDIAFANEQPYDNYEAKIVQDGLEIIPNGIAVLNGVEDDSASLTVLSGNVDFFDALSGKLYEMGDATSPYGINTPFEPYQHTWNVDNVAASQTHTSGWIWPVVDYGNLVYNATGNNDVNVRNLRPGFFIKTAIDLMVASVGYKAIGSLLSNPLYPLLIAQFSNDAFNHGTDYQNRPNPTGLLATTGADFSVSHFTAAGNKGIIPFTIINNDEAGQYNGSNTFISKRISNVVIKVTIPRMRFQGKPDPTHGSYLKISIHKQTEADEILVEHTIDIATFTRVPGTSGGGLLGYVEPENIIVSAQTDMAIGDQINVRYEFFEKRPSQFTLYAGATFEISPTSQQVLYGQDVQCERIFPDITQKDLLKDVLQRFGIVCQTDSNTRSINFASFKDIVGNIPIAKNWSRKCLDQGKSISFQLGNYAQVNYLKYKEDDAVVPKGFADSQINVKDKTLPASADLFESQFAPTQNRPYIGNSIALIKMIEDGSTDNDFSIGVSPRILIDKKIDLRNYGGKTVKFTDGNPANDKYVNDYISVPYFYKSGEEYSLLWEDLRKAYYPELEKILQQTKKVVRYFILNPRDILELDLLIPIYLEQDSAYYYINKIDSWRKGQPVRVELVKLG